MRLYVVCCGVYIYMRRRRSVSDIRTVSFGKNVMPKISPERVLHSSVTFILLFLCVSAVCSV